VKLKIAKPKKFRQNTEVTEHYHPRWLARAVARNRLKQAGAERINKSVAGNPSPFSRLWRDAVDEATAK